MGEVSLLSRQGAASIPHGSCFPPSTTSRKDHPPKALGQRLPHALGSKQNLFSMSICISTVNIPAAANIPGAFSLLIFSPRLETMSLGQYLFPSFLLTWTLEAVYGLLTAHEAHSYVAAGACSTSPGL